MDATEIDSYDAADSMVDDGLDDAAAYDSGVDDYDSGYDAADTSSDY